MVVGILHNALFFRVLEYSEAFFLCLCKSGMAIAGYEKLLKLSHKKLMRNAISSGKNNIMSKPNEKRLKYGLRGFWPFEQRRKSSEKFEQIHLPDDGREYLKPSVENFLQELHSLTATAQRQIHASNFYFKGEHAFKNKKYDQAVEFFEASKKNIETVSGYLSQGVSLLMISKLKKATEVFTYGRDLAKQRSTPHFQVAFGINLGQVYFDLGKPDLPFNALEEARNILNIFFDENLTEVVLRQLGMLMFMQGTYSKGLSYCESVDTHQKRDILNEAKILLVKALLIFGKGKFKKAKRTLIEGLNVLSSSPNNHTKARLLLQLAHFHFTDNNGCKSKQVGEKALRVFREISDERGIARCLSFLAIFDFSDGRYGEGEKKLDQARQLDRITSYRRGEVRLLVMQGKLYLQQGNIEKAKQIIQEADQIARDIGHIPALLETSSLIATTSSFMLPTNDSFDILEDCLMQSRKIPIPEREIELCHQISALCLTEGKISDAFFYSRQAIERSQQICNPLCEAKSHISLSRVLSQTGNEIGATEHLGFAQAILQYIGFKAESANHMI